MNVINASPLTFSNTYIDKGYATDEKTQFDFDFKVNTGHAVVIKAIKSSCPCLEYEVIPAKTKFSPGENGKIRCTLQTSGPARQLEYSLFVETIGAKIQKSILTVKVVSMTTFTAIPKTILFRTYKSDNEHYLVKVIKDIPRSEETWTYAGIEAQDPKLEIKYVGSDIHEQSRGFGYIRQDFNFEFSRPAYEIMKDSTVKIKFENKHANKQEVVCHIINNTVEDIYLDKNTLHYYGTKKEDHILLTSKYSINQDNIKIDFDKKLFKINIEHKDKSILIKVELNQNVKKKNGKSDITVTVTNKGQMVSYPIVVYITNE